MHFGIGFSVAVGTGLIEKRFQHLCGHLGVKFSYWTGCNLIRKDKGRIL